MPGDLQVNDSKEKFAKVFGEKLRCVWQPIALSRDGIQRLQDAFIDNSINKEVVIHKIVEVKVHGDDYKPREKKNKKSKSSDSEESRMSIEADEYAAVKSDVKELKGIIKLIKKKGEAISTGLKGFYDHFDRNNSDELELAEFIKMI